MCPSSVYKRPAEGEAAAADAPAASCAAACVFWPLGPSQSALSAQWAYGLGFGVLLMFGLRPLPFLPEWLECTRFSRCFCAAAVKPHRTSAGPSSAAGPAAATAASPAATAADGTQEIPKQQPAGDCQTSENAAWEAFAAGFSSTRAAVAAALQQEEDAVAAASVTAAFRAKLAAKRSKEGKPVKVYDGPLWWKYWSRKKRPGARN